MFDFSLLDLGLAVRLVKKKLRLKLWLKQSARQACSTDAGHRPRRWPAGTELRAPSGNAAAITAVRGHPSWHLLIRSTMSCSLQSYGCWSPIVDQSVTRS